MIVTIALFACTLLLDEAKPATQPASMPIDTSKKEGNRLRRTPNDVHRLYRKDFPAPDPHAPPISTWTSEVVEAEFPFNDLVPSWNVDVPDGASARLEFRVGRKTGDWWSAWYFLGIWGALDGADREGEKHTEDADAEINIDYLQSRHRFDRFQYRITAVESSNPGSPHVAVRRVTVAYSNTLNDPELAAKFRQSVDPGPKEKWARRLPVPYRSQRWEDEKIRGSICSPTSTSMVLEFRGIKHPTTEVAARIFDHEYRMYGNWWRAVQGAYSFGLPGYVERFGDWNAVKRHIANGQPVIASIKVRQGQLRNSPYRQTDGHLLVITGFTDTGDVCINDPAANNAEQGQTIYPREDMETVWLANGGIGYIMEPAPR